MSVKSPASGMRISEYVLEARIGAGGFGQVWKARHHLWTDTVVAIKFPTEPGRVQEIANEGILQHQLDHPNIVKTLGLDPGHELPYVICEYVPGSSLREILQREGRLEVRRALGILRQILWALDHAHKRGVVHLDVKPGNILITEEGLVKLGDFGVGRILGSGRPLALSGSLGTDEAPGGTLAYLSPEQRDGSGPADHRSDLYSLGIVLFEMLTGTMPQGVEFPRQLRPDLPEWLDRVFGRLYTRVESRYGAASEVLRDLSEHTDAPAREGVQADVRDSEPGAADRSGAAPAGRRLLEAHARDRLGLTPREFERLCGEGRLHPFSMAGVRYVDEGEVEEYERSRRSHPGGSDAGERSDVDFPRDAPGGAGGAGGAADREPVPAGFVVRLLAHGVDLVLLAWVGILPAIFLKVRGLDRLLAWVLPSGGGIQNWVVLCGTVWLVYLTVAHCLYGRTLGKLALGIRVVREDSLERPGVASSVIRSLGYLISFLPFPLIPLGFLWIPFSPKKRGLHDHMAGTRVIHG